MFAPSRRLGFVLKLVQGEVSLTYKTAKLAVSRFFYLVTLVALFSGCGGLKAPHEPAKIHEDLLEEINQLRQTNHLAPLALNETMNATAHARARESAAKGVAEPDNNRLPVLVKAGTFSRFALSHEIVVSSLSDVVETLTTNPIAKSKLLHPRISHVGFVLSQSRP